MAKKKPAAPVQVRNPEGADKVRFELRFDKDVFERVRDLAEGAGVSVNQLMQGLARWGVQRLRLGEPVRDDAGRVSHRRQPGCLWAGREASDVVTDDGEIVPDTSSYGRGEVYVCLDFTERRVVRDDLGGE